MEDIKSIVAKNITELRLLNNMTQMELAEKLNYSDKTISKWERAESSPDIAVLVDIADLFGVSLDYLVSQGKQAKGNEIQSQSDFLYFRKCGLVYCHLRLYYHLTDHKRGYIPMAVFCLCAADRADRKVGVQLHLV